jgi:hypothetical protein
MTKLELSNIPNPSRIKKINIEYNGFGQSAHSMHTIETIVITAVLLVWGFALWYYWEGKKK